MRPVSLSFGGLRSYRERVEIDFTDIDRVKRDYFAAGTAFEGLVTFGVNLRGLSQSEERTYHRDMAAAMERGLPVAIHASQAPPNVVDAADYEKDLEVFRQSLEFVRGGGR